MATDTQNAVGTQRQFRKNPQGVYQTGLKNPSFGSHLSRGADFQAEKLASSLGILGKKLWQEKVHSEERSFEQFNLDEGMKMVAGLNQEDLAKFDTHVALLHSDSGYNLTDNKYAIAIMERARGRQAAFLAKQKYLEENEGKVPKSVSDAVSAYTEQIADTVKTFEDQVKNKEAFNSGLYESFYQDTLTVSDNARTLIDNAYREEGIRTQATIFQNLVVNSKNLDPTVFNTQLQEINNTLQLCTKNIGEATNIWHNLLQNNADYLKDTKLLDTLKELNIFTDSTGKEHKLGDEIPMAKLYEIAVDNTIKDEVKPLLEKIKNNDGTYDVTKIKELVKEHKAEKEKEVDEKKKEALKWNETLPINEGQEESVASLQSQWHNGVMSTIYQRLKDQGLTDICITSGKRYAGEAGNAGERSLHVSGNAIDIWIGAGHTREEGNKIAQIFKDMDCFDEVIWEMKGDPTGATGDHLHLGGYKGGYDKPQIDLSVYSYSPEYFDKMEQEAERQAVSANNLTKIKWDKNEKDLKVALYQAKDNFEEQRNLIKNSPLPDFMKVDYLGRVDSRLKQLQESEKRRASGILSPYDLYWEKYGRLQSVEDEHTRDELFAKRKQEGGLSEEEDAKLDIVLHRLDAYYSYLSYQNGIKYTSQYGYINGRKVFVDSESIADFEVFAKEAREKGYTDQQIQQAWNDNNW